MIGFNDFIKKHNLRNKATSNMKTQQVLSSLSLKDVGFFLRNGPFSTDVRIVKLHSSKGTHWVLYTDENYFDSYGCTLPQKLPKFIIKQTDIVHILNTKFKVLQINGIFFVLGIVYIYFT